MSSLLILVIVVGTLALFVAGVTGLEIMRRRRVLTRAGGIDAPTPGAVVLRPEKERKSRVSGWLESLGEGKKADESLGAKLVQAGMDTPVAPAIYFLLRVSALVIFPLVTILVMPRENFRLYVLAMVTAVFMGFILPAALLDRMVRLRQERIRRAVPDALDLLVVCVEAGVSLDAAILRVAKDIRLVHTDLAHELGVVNRLTNAGMPRDQALRGLWQRTGVEDIRTLVSSLIQSEKWGTSIATVLRVAAETLRRKRRQLAEKKAKQAPLKMTFPLLFFILPALFAVIMGPAVAQIVKEFGKV
jgi:tight adherence protein C